MIDLSQVQPHNEIVGGDGGHIGTVDHIVDNAIKLTRKDSADNRHHYIDVGLIASIERGRFGSKPIPPTPSPSWKAKRRIALRTLAWTRGSRKPFRLATRCQPSTSPSELGCPRSGTDGRSALLPHRDRQSRDSLRGSVERTRASQPCGLVPPLVSAVPCRPSRPRSWRPEA